MEFDIENFEKEVLEELDKNINDYETSPWNNSDFIIAAFNHYTNYYSEGDYPEYNDEINAILDTIPKDKWSDKTFLLDFIPKFNEKYDFLFKVDEKLWNDSHFVKYLLRYMGGNTDILSFASKDLLKDKGVFEFAFAGLLDSEATIYIGMGSYIQDFYKIFKYMSYMTEEVWNDLDFIEYTLLPACDEFVNYFDMPALTYNGFDLFIENIPNYVYSNEEVMKRLIKYFNFFDKQYFDKLAKLAPISIFSDTEFALSLLEDSDNARCFIPNKILDKLGISE